MKAIVLLTALAAILVAGCGPQSNEETKPRGDPEFHMSVHEALVADGRLAYNTYCAGCHGESGDGWGKAARFMHPRPRNFQQANFKFSSTRSGLLPTDADLKRTIRYGLRGSAMPSWRWLSEGTIDALIAYLKTFSPKWSERQPASAVPFLDDPYRSKPDKSAAVARGEAVFHGFATCWTCHPSYVPKKKINAYLVAMENPTRDAFRDGLFESEAKPNDEGEVIFPPDFRRDFVRSGMALEDIYRVIAAGITGTAMPTWVDSMSFPSTTRPGSMLVKPSDLWALAYYVQDLIKQRPSRLTLGTFEIRERTQSIYPVGDPPVFVPPDETGETDEVFEEFDEDELD